MISRLSFFLIVLSLNACGHMKNENTKSGDHSQEISNFIQEHVSEFQGSMPKHKAYAISYKNYLESVSNIYRDTGESAKFNDYLNTLKVQSRELKKFSQNLSQRYTKETKKKADPRSKDFQLYRTKKMTEFNDQLNEGRFEKIKGQLDQETFNKLVENNKEFNERNEAGKPEFLFPL